MTGADDRKFANPPVGNIAYGGIWKTLVIGHDGELQ